MNNKFTEASLNYFFNERNNARKEYDKKIATISNNFFIDNNRITLTIFFVILDQIIFIDINSSKIKNTRYIK